MFSLQKRICNLTLSALRNSGRMKLVRNLTVFFFFVLPLLNSLLLFYWRITSIWQLIYFCINNWMCLLTAGELWMYGCWFYRPGETFHLATRKFLEKEVFKSDYYNRVPFSKILGKCVVLFVKVSNMKQICLNNTFIWPRGSQNKAICHERLCVAMLVKLYIYIYRNILLSFQYFPHRLLNNLAFNCLECGIVVLGVF